MTGRKVIIGLCAMCALLVCAFAAQSASALGTTGHTCKKVTKTQKTAGFSKSHCREADKVTENAEYEHFAYANGTVTKITASDLNTNGEHTGAILKSTIAGSAIELVATEVSGTGTTTNSEGLNAEGKNEMVASGEGTLVYKGVTEKLLGCKVTGKPGGAGVVETKTLFATTKEQGMGLKFTPKEGAVFAEFELTECIVGPLVVKVVGSVLGEVDGATTNTVHNTITAAKTLRLQSAAGPVAGIAGTLTFIGKDEAAGDKEYTPLSATTTP